MAYVITEACIDIKDKSCMAQCPVDCIYEGGHALYINPEECIECGACEPACPVEAVFYEEELPEDKVGAIASNAAFFTEILPGRSEPLGLPRGFKNLGPLDVDTEYVSRLAAR